MFVSVGKEPPGGNWALWKGQGSRAFDIHDTNALTMKYVVDLFEYKCINAMDTFPNSGIERVHGMYCAVPNKFHSSFK